MSPGVFQCRCGSHRCMEKSNFPETIQTSGERPHDWNVNRKVSKRSGDPVWLWTPKWLIPCSTQRTQQQRVCVWFSIFTGSHEGPAILKVWRVAVCEHWYSQINRATLATVNKQDHMQICTKSSARLSQNEDHNSQGSLLHCCLCQLCWNGSD